MIKIGVKIYACKYFIRFLSEKLIRKKKRLHFENCSNFWAVLRLELSLWDGGGFVKKNMHFCYWCLSGMKELWWLLLKGLAHNIEMLVVPSSMIQNNLKVMTAHFDASKPYSLPVFMQFHFNFAESSTVCYSNNLHEFITNFQTVVSDSTNNSFLHTAYRPQLLQFANMICCQYWLGVGFGSNCSIPHSFIHQLICRFFFAIYFINVHKSSFAHIN